MLTEPFWAVKFLLVGVEDVGKWCRRGESNRAPRLKTRNLLIRRNARTVNTLKVSNSATRQDTAVAIRLHPRRSLILVSTVGHGLACAPQIQVPIVLGHFSSGDSVQRIQTNATGRAHQIIFNAN